MSHIGKRPINIPAGVEIKIEKDIVKCKGLKGELGVFVCSKIKVEIKDQKIFVSLKEDSNDLKTLWGTTAALIANAIEGVTKGYEKQLEISGVGYRAQVQGKKLVLNLGFTHPIEIIAPEGITFKVQKNAITVAGIDKQIVGEIAAKIRGSRPPEPYKGKGIKYSGEHIRKKAGKKAVASGTA